MFKAWGASDHVKRWFCPADYTAPEARVQMRVGGPFEVCMRSPDGVEHWTRGVFVEVAPPDRLALDLHVTDAQGRPLFRAFTEVGFFDDAGGTRVEVAQSYVFADPAAAAPMVAGARLGWAQTLDKLAAEAARIAAQGQVERSVVHGAFHLERTFDAPVERVFQAFADPVAKQRWFGGEPDRWRALERSMDFQVGGRERARGRWESGMVTTFDAVYHDIVDNQRIVYTYEMHLDATKISVSLATVELRADGPRRTVLTITEQGAFLDGYDDAGAREEGTAGLLERIAATL